MRTHLRNEGKQPHELSILTLNPGKTPADFTAFMKAADSGKKASGPPPFANAGGFTILDPGLDGYVTLDLAPGTYLGADFIPDPTKKNAPHLLNGGQVPFTVPA